MRFRKGLSAAWTALHPFGRKVSPGKTTPEQRDAWAANITAVDDLAVAVGDADLVIEAVPELPDLKHSIFAQLDKLAPAHAILGTNTSSLSIADIAGATSNPDAIGMHFFNPVPIMKLLELVRHERTSQDTITTAQEAGQAMGKTCILVKDIPGFATSRLGVVLGNEAIRMLADGVASAKDIDTAMVLGYKHPMGPLALTDLVGLDVRRTSC